MSDFIEDFLNDLDKDKSNFGNNFSDRIAKIFFSFDENHGVLVFAPFIDKATHRPYISLPGVREFKMISSKYKNGSEAGWLRILPKQVYGNLTEEQSALYDKVGNLWDQLYADLGEKDGSSAFIRYKTYSLFQGIILKQVSGGKEVTDNVNKAALLVYPGKSPINSLAAAIEAKVASIGNKEWLSAIFSPTADNRDGAISISFGRKTDGGFGYTATVQFEMNSNWSKVIDSSAFKEEEVNKLGDMIVSFLGWQSLDENTAFDSKLFEEAAKAIAQRIKAPSDAAPDNGPAPENKNGVDPMINNAGNAEAPTEAPTPESQSHADGPAPEQGPTVAPANGTVKYPF